MLKALLIFPPTFILIMTINQMFYGACFKDHCLSAALPKVIFFSLVATGLLYWGTSKDGSGKGGKSKRDSLVGIACLGIVFVPLSLVAGFGAKNAPFALFVLTAYLGISCVFWREQHA